MGQENNAEKPEQSVQNDQGANAANSLEPSAEEIALDPDSTSDVAESMEVSTSDVETEKTEEVPSAQATTDVEEANTSDEAAVDDEDDHVESLQSEDEEEDDLPDFVAMGTEELVKLAEKLVKEKEIAGLRPYFDGIRPVLESRFDALYKENLELFIEQGGNAIDFRFSNPLRDDFRRIFNQYRKERRSYYHLLERELESNLHKKERLIEELKELLQKEESIADSFKELRSIQERWKEIGPVPKNESDNLWRTYHFHLDNFYDYVRLNENLLDLDFQKNKEAKEKLIHEAEELDKLDSIREAMARLQDLHKRWKFTGPVQRELREPYWQRFNEATHRIHEKRDAHREEMKKRDEERIAGKAEIVLKMESFDTSGLRKHPEWQEATAQMDALFDAFKKLGRVNHPENDPLWKSAKQAYRLFIHKKNEHYKEIKKEQKANLDRKRALVEKAESLKDSENWRDTTNEFKKLQAEWKEIGFTSRKEGEQVWKAFRSACDHFFNRMKEDRKAFKNQQKEKVSAKQEVIDELEKLVEDEKKLSKNQLLELAKKFRKIGRLPRDFQKVEDRFEEVLQSGFDKLKIDKQEAAQAQFEQKLDALSEQGDDQGMKREEQHIRKQLENEEKEVQQLENNIQFFRHSKGTNPMIQQVERKIQHHRERMDELKTRLRQLKKAIREEQKD